MKEWSQGIQNKGLEVSIKQEAWDKVMGWCRAAESEVSGLGLVKVDDAGKLMIYDALLLDQTASGASTILNKTAITDLMAKLHKDEVPLSHLKLWWHTHYNFDAFWSGTDEDTCKKLCGSSDWNISIVVNKRSDCKCRLDMNAPLRLIVDADLNIVYEPKDNDKYKEEVKLKVKTTGFHGFNMDDHIGKKSKKYPHLFERGVGFWNKEIKGDNVPSDEANERFKQWEKDHPNGVEKSNESDEEMLKNWEENYPYD